MTPREWRLARRVTEILAGEVGLTDRMLAERLDVTVAELRAPIGMLLGRGKVQRCGDYLVATDPASPGGDAR